MKLEFGDIYLVRFHPVVGSELKRYRPAVVVSDKVNKIDTRFTLVAPFSTNIKLYNRNHELLVNNSALEQESALLLWYLRTVDIVRLEKKLGELTLKDKTKLKTKLIKLLQ